MQILRDTSQKGLTEEFVQSLVGKIIHVPINKLNVFNSVEGRMEEVNAWFGGLVVGYEKAVLHYDYYNKTDLEEPKVFFNVLLKDGMGYALSQEELEIRELDEIEWAKLLAEHHKEEIVQQVMEKEILVPEKPRILKPGEDF